MPVAVADRLRADGIALRPDHDVIAAAGGSSPRPSWPAYAGPRLRPSPVCAPPPTCWPRPCPPARGCRTDGEPLTAEMVRAELRDACRRSGAPAPPDVIVASLWQGGGHDPGSGPLPADLPIVIDLWPRDEPSGCWADMTRTLVVGEATEGVRVLEPVVREALERSREAVRPGITGRELHAVACEVFEASRVSHAAHRSRDDPEEGFQFSLGHGVGLAVHEDPALGQAGHDPLVAGDVIAIEPGLWQRDTGEVRFEDLLLVTEDGCETLTSYPYELTP